MHFYCDMYLNFHSLCTFNISISGPYAALMSYLAEVHNDAQRSRTYMWLGVFFSLGNISLPCEYHFVILHDLFTTIIFLNRMNYDKYKRNFL